MDTNKIMADGMDTNKIMADGIDTNKIMADGMDTNKIMTNFEMKHRCLSHYGYQSLELYCVIFVKMTCNL